MEEMKEEVPEIRLCTVTNEVEAALVVELLREEDICARSDASNASNAFGGLQFEPGHKIYVPASQAKVAREILAQLSPFQGSQGRSRARPLTRRRCSKLRLPAGTTSRFGSASLSATFIRSPAGPSDRLWPRHLKWCVAVTSCTW